MPEVARYIFSHFVFAVNHYTVVMAVWASPDRVPRADWLGEHALRDMLVDELPGMMLPCVHLRCCFVSRRASVIRCSGCYTAPGDGGFEGGTMFELWMVLDCVHDRRAAELALQGHTDDRYGRFVVYPALGAGVTGAEIYFEAQIVRGRLIEALARAIDEHEAYS